MSKAEVQFFVPVSCEFASKNLSQLVANWVTNFQSNTSGFAKAWMAQGEKSDLINIITLATGKEKGVRILGPNSIKVQIPTSGTTMGGEMVVTVNPAQGNTAEFKIVGKTLGLVSGTLDENISGLAEYLKVTFPEIEALNKKPLGTNRMSTTTISDEIERFHEMHQKGILNADEFAEAKKMILSGNNDLASFEPVVAVEQYHSGQDIEEQEPPRKRGILSRFGAALNSPNAPFNTWEAENKKSEKLEGEEVMNDSTQPVIQDKWTEIMKDKNSDNNKSKVLGFLFVLCFGPLGLLYTSVTAAFITILAFLGSWVIVAVLFIINPVLGFLGCLIPTLIYLSIFVTYVKLSKYWVN